MSKRRYGKSPMKINGTWRAPLDGGRHLVHVSPSPGEAVATEMDALCLMITYALYKEAGVGESALTSAEEYELGMSRKAARLRRELAVGAAHEVRMDCREVRQLATA